MRLSNVVPPIAALGLVCSPLAAQPTLDPDETSNAAATDAEDPARSTVAPDTLVAPGPAAPLEPDVSVPPPAVEPPPAYPQAPDVNPQEPQPPPPPPRDTSVHFGGRELAPGMRRPPRYRYVEGTPLPEGYHLESRANRALVIGGAVTFGVPYLIGTFGTLSVVGDGGPGWLAIPIVGPWLTLANRRSNCGEIGEPSPGGFEYFTDEVGNGMLIASGVLQTLGVTMITLGIVNTREYAIADYAKVQITPVATPRGDYGLVLSGTM